MPSHYGNEEVPPTPKKEMKATSSRKMTEQQKKQLKNHMDKHKDKMSPTEFKSHRMKMMARMRKGMSIAKAHKDIMG